MPKYSIVLPTYNSADEIMQSIKSCLDINYSDYELIISDNCSSDNTEKILNEVKSDKVKFFLHDKVLNKTDNWNRAYSYIKNSEYFISLHSGSMLDKNIFINLDKIINKDTSLIFGRNQEINNNNQIQKSRKLFFFLKYSMNNSNFTKLILSQPVVSIIGTCFRTKDFFSIGGWNNKYEHNQDTEMWLQLSKKGLVTYTPKILGYFKTNEQNITLLTNYFTRNLNFYYDKYFEYDKKFKNCAVRALDYYTKGYIRHNLKSFDENKFNKIQKIIKDNPFRISNSIFCNYLKLISIF